MKLEDITNQEIFSIVDELTSIHGISEDSITRKIAASVFNIEVENVTVTHFINLGIIIAKELIKRLKAKEEQNREDKWYE